MDNLLDKSESLSNVIPIVNDDIILLNSTVFGVIYYKSLKLFQSKWKRRFFELNDYSLDLWNPKKSHKSCIRINKIYKYQIKSISNKQLLGESGMLVKLTFNNKTIELFSAHENIKLFINKINEFMIN
tara:strand:+ start:332 stop:715 length:384 start_codon:yes stop_codon:yes gene_type:complete